MLAYGQIAITGQERPDMPTLADRMKAEGERRPPRSRILPTGRGTWPVGRTQIRPAIRTGSKRGASLGNDGDRRQVHVSRIGGLPPCEGFALGSCLGQVHATRGNALLLGRDANAAGRRSHCHWTRMTHSSLEVSVSGRRSGPLGARVRHSLQTAVSYATITRRYGSG